MNDKYKTLFEKVTLKNGVELKNKFALGPMTHISSHDNGTISDAEIEYMRLRSKDVGLSISAASNVTDLGKAFPGQPSVVRDSDIEGLTRLADAMKENGAKAILQIHHGGAQAIPRLTPNSDSAGPSPITMQSFDETEPHEVREITEEEIIETIKAFGEATRRAAEAGFDGVEIHGANHYIIHQFVSPYFNKRTDKWGEDPFLFAMKIVDAVTKAKEKYAEDDFIIGYRFSPEEKETPGIRMETTKELIGKLIEKPIDYLHASLSEVHSKTREGKYKDIERIELLHQWIDGQMPLIGIGSVFTADQALRAIEEGNMEIIALGRVLLLDYNFISKIEEGREDEIFEYFDRDREDKYGLPELLWGQLDKGFYPMPKK
ncbi:NADH-dependent flavin oxidoreductase [Jeotgalicoccus nanhaiensis]|uniref:NADH-dependent flavin oxidoreductase n=1 Tax=Jeotgalicoccus nanhaiensis TaxID=568603 RepID=A0ABR9XXZ5_9STAP|nr:NADH-dependent flavin oxidoreductase [Jeotgalicoccus nanhaiensis]MBF0753723.1 NADH-dependent flavin oxidoreductase [Jeotgalicoccus nanhaiensis]TFU61887.1 NADH-dependent flavin oxidoreductase [Jeotgalicoccus nanhaiensis]